MALLHRMLAGVHQLLRGRDDADLDLELDDYLRTATEQKVAAGMSPEEAERSARLEMGGFEQIKEHAREIRWESAIDRLSQDLRHAIRSLAASKAFTAVSILTLALGIGANTAIFSILNGVILRPLGYPKPDQLMFFSTRAPALGLDSFWVSPVEYFEFRELNQSFSNVGAFHVGEVNLFDGDQPRRVRSAVVDEHLMATLGIPAEHGRLFANDETNGMAPTITRGQPPPGTRPVVILSHELWQAAFGGRPMVGRRIDIEGVSREVIGVLPPGVDLMDHRPEVWLPIGLNPADRQNRAGHFLSVLGRLRGGVAIGTARAELLSLIDNWGERVGVGAGEGVAGHLFEPPNRTMDRGKKVTNPGHVLQFTPLKEEQIGSAARSIWMLQASVGLLLLIACANLASLFMARADTRRREFAVRTALGATPKRLVQQFITEGLLLAIAGGTLGVIIARTGIAVFVRTYPDSLPRTGGVAIDGVVLLFAAGVAVTSALLFASAPLVHTRMKGLAAAIREGTDRHAGSPRQRARAALVIAEIALAVILVAGAGLLTRSVLNLTNVDVGFSPSRLITFSTTLPQARYPPASRPGVYQSMLARLRGVPGVTSASAMSGLPPERAVATMATDFDGYVAGPGDPPEFADYEQYVLDSYFQTMGIPILQGRGFEASDATSPDLVVIVNKTLAETFWKGRDPIGQRLRPCCFNQPWATVVGVAADVKQGGIDKKAGTEIYFSLDQRARRGTVIGTMHVVLRTTASFDETAPFIRDFAREIDPTVPIVRLREMDDVFQESISRPRLLAHVVGIFAGLALLIAVIGTYGLLSYTVTSRRREIGIRLALGASRAAILAQILRWGLALVLIGAVVGVVAAIGLSEFITSLLFGIAATDATTLVAVVAGVMAVGTLACSIPAWRASRLDPLLLIRED